MHAAKHFDPQLGLDIHLYVFPPLPVPIPLPTPHLGIVLDPFDYIPVIGGTVHINGVKRATAGTGGLDIHIPLGIWMPTMRMPMGPQWDDEIFMGSMTVVADGDPLSRIAMPVLDCNIVGLINPFRLRKPKKPQLSLSLPTAVNLAIPNHVNVGGPPMISIMGMAFKGLFAGLGRLRKLKAVQRVATSAGNRWRKVFGNMDPGFLKCKVLRAEPVDIRSGAVSVTHEDFSIPGRLPLTWTRRYRSDEIDHAGVCGHGWTTPADIHLEVGEDGVVFHPVQGPPAVYERLPLPGEGLVDSIDGARLTRVKGTQGDAKCEELHLRTKDDIVHVFAAPPAHVVPMPGQPARRLRIERLEDRCGNAWTFERDGEHITRIVERGLDTSPGRFISVGGQGGRIHAMALHDPISGQSWPLVSYRHDAQGDLVAALDALDAARTFDYRAHRMVRHTDRVGLSFHYEYDRQARVVHSWGDGGLYDYKFAYHDELHETEVTDSLGHVSLVKFDEAGLPLCEIDPLGGCTFFEYDEWGRTTGVTLPEGLRTGFEYDVRGNLTACTRPDGSCTRTEYDDDDRPRCLVAPDGARWLQAIDDRGMPCSHTDALGAVVRFQHDARGQMICHVNPRGAETRLGFDHHGLLATLTGPTGQVSRFEHDARGRLARQVDPLGQATTYQYDAKGRLLQVSLPGGRHIACEYDAEDQLLCHVDASGLETRVAYVGTGQVARRVQTGSEPVHYHYDTEQQLVGVSNQRGERYVLVRDALGRIVEEVDYWGQATRHAYDGAGRVVSSADALGQTIRYRTDAMGRITGKSWFDTRSGQTATEQLFYDKCGRVTAFQGPGSSVKRRFDAVGRLLEEIQNGFRVTSSYDAAGNRVRRDTSAGNRVTYEYDLLDQPSQVGINDEPAIVITRDALGRTCHERFGQGLQRSFEHDAAGMLIRQQVLAGSHTIIDTRYEHDRAGNLARRRDRDQGEDLFHHDPLGQLLRHTNPHGQVETYLRDPAGDRLRTRIREVELKKAVGGEAAPTLWSREGAVDGLHYVFDRAGNLVRRGRSDRPAPDDLELTWDANHRLARSRLGDRVTTYRYDAFGRRIEKRCGDRVTRFYWDADVILAEVTAPADEALQPALESGKVVELSQTRARAERLAAHHRDAREYVHGPDGFVPLALIEGQSSPIAAHPAKATPQAAAPQPMEPVGAGLGTRDDNGFGSLGGGAMLGGSSAPPTTVTPQPLIARLGGAPLAGPVTGPPTGRAPDQLPLPASPAMPQRVTLYFQVEPNGCPTRLMDGEGRILWQARLTAWGAVAECTVERVRNPIRFQGQYLDDETGLHYNRNRYYDAHAGQFISADPLGLEPGENLYEYGPSPFSWIDPLGLAKGDPSKGYKGIVDGKVGDGNQAHHVLPQDLWKRHGQDLRNLGIEMNDSRNLLLMPGSEVKRLELGKEVFHCGSHGRYNKRVEGFVTSILMRQDMDPAYKAAQIRRLQDALKSDIADGSILKKLNLKNCRLG